MCLRLIDRVTGCSKSRRTQTTSSGSSSASSSASLRAKSSSGFRTDELRSSLTCVGHSGAAGELAAQVRAGEAPGGEPRHERAREEIIALSKLRHPVLLLELANRALDEEQLLRLENAKLKAEIEKLRGTLGMPATDAVGSPSPASPSCASQKIHSPGSLDDYVEGFLLDHDKARILELANRALDELTTMCSAAEPLWVRSVETGRDVLNYDEYLRLFPHEEDSGGRRAAGWSVEASRETGIVYLDPTRLVRAFMDVVYYSTNDLLTALSFSTSNQWKELFPSMISKASMLSVIQPGDNDGGQDGVVQLMFAEVQMLTPVLPTREYRFLRYCKKLTAEKWATVDVSLDKVEHASSSTACRCLRKPSGCVVEEQTNGHCKVTWVEHTTCRNVTVPSMYRAAAASGLAFGARRWVAALQLQCERMVFSVATNIPTRDSNGVSTMAGRRSVLKLAHRMSWSLCRGIGASRGMAWSKAPNGNGGGDVRVTSRKNTGDPGEPQGLIACAVLSTWLPVSPAALLGFLRDETRRHEVADTARPLPPRVSQAADSSSEPEDKNDGKWILQDSCTGPCESILVYAPVDAAILRPVIDGHDSSEVALLPCGFAVTPDGLDSRSAVITSTRDDDEMMSRAAGSLVAVAFQALVPAGAASPATGGAIPPDSVATVTGLVSRTLDNIKKALRCEDC
ncbi:hypothetical protein PR202_gb04681 [Eleusine coracana subsp. coracana]|uniref:START domain-containing protein n=1 Tax=Eleusine coracana subsp. coracana TaxID=191504 RepID=A0AAV5E4Z0_ELECO|nr:hypothetical protein PR202_gb04681 [Eleusine coracana subsp. coracana]